MAAEVINLYVDDIRPGPDGWRVVRSIADAKLLLEAGDIDACSLDHDMGICAACAPSFNSKGLAMPHCSHVGTGLDLVRWMIETGHWPKQKPTVHSMNPVGAKRMREDIERYFPE